MFLFLVKQGVASNLRPKKREKKKKKDKKGKKTHRGKHRGLATAGGSRVGTSGGSPASMALLGTVCVDPFPFWYSWV